MGWTNEMMRFASGLRLTIGAIAALGAMGTPALCQADVTASSPGGFVLKLEVPIAATPDDVFKRFLDIGQWWSSDHSYSGKASNMTLQNTPGGCFCEALDDGGFVRHGSVEYSMPGKFLRLSTALGPLQEFGAYGMMSVRFQPGGTGTRVAMTYTVSGYEPNKGLNALAPLVNAVLTEQFTRLKKLIETGKPGP